VLAFLFGALMKVIEGGFGKKAAANLSADLRELADAVDRGEIVDLCAAYIQNDNYAMLYAASNRVCLELSTLLQRSCEDKYFV
jgi:hypothetical protein